jgi:hypothetical protein
VEKRFSGEKEPDLAHATLHGLLNDAVGDGKIEEPTLPGS